MTVVSAGTARLLAICIVAILATWLSARWWPRLAGIFRGRSAKAGPPLKVALAGLGLAYGLECLLALAAGGFILPGTVPATAAGLPATTGAAVAWMVHYVRLLPYAGVALFVYIQCRNADRPSRPESMEQSPWRGSWASVRPVFQTLVPWAIVFLTACYFPSVRLPSDLGAALADLVRMGLFQLVPNLLVMPFFLGLLAPSAGRALEGWVSSRWPTEDPGSPLARRRVSAFRVATVVIGAFALLAWAAWLPRPSLTRTVPGSSMSILVNYGLTYLVAAVVQQADRNVLWPALVSPVVWVIVGMVPRLFGQAFVW